MNNDPTDHLGTPVEPGSVLCYSYGSPTNARNRMYYGVVHEMVKNPQTDEPIIRVRSIPSTQDMQCRIDYCKKYAHSKYKLTSLKGILRRSTFKGQSFTVVGRHQLPADYAKGLTELEKLSQMGAGPYLEQY